MKENFLKDIWQKHIDVQEQMLKMRSTPINIIPNKFKIVDDKLFLTADDNFTTNILIDEIAPIFQISPDSIDLGKNHFLVDSTIAHNLAKEQIVNLSERLAKYFINLTPSPILDGVIKLKNNNSIRVDVIPNPTIYLHRKCPLVKFTHETFYVNNNKTDERITTDIELSDSQLANLNKLIGIEKSSDKYYFKNCYNYSYDFLKWKTFFDTSLNLDPDKYDAYINKIVNYYHDKNIQVLRDSNSLIIPMNKQADDLIYDMLKLNKALYFYNISIFDSSTNMNNIENLLREKFPSIQTKTGNRKDNIYFWQEYQTKEQSLTIRDMLISEFNEFDRTSFDLHFSDIPDNKVKYSISLDKKAKYESLSEAIKALRGADFRIENIDLGKLTQVYYPKLTFDVLSDKLDEIKSYFESSTVISIEPNLTGEIEKINRLKNSFENIINGKNLLNPKLKDFIFDAGKATKIDNIDCHANPSSEIYKELEHHLLNKYINSPQKEAIIKSLLAKDLALIQGPPGTGKSTAIAEIIWQHIRKNAQERILLTSETNLAVDNAIDRIVNKNNNMVKPIRIGGEDRISVEGRQFSIELMKQWVEKGFIDLESEDLDEELLPQKLILQNWLENIESRVDSSMINGNTFELWSNLLKNPTKHIRQIFYNHYIQNCNVIGATCSSIAERNTKNNPTSFFKSYCEIFGKVNNRYYSGNLAFTTIIQDESSKATPAELSLPLVYGRKSIVIGDHRQLPPMLDKEEFLSSLDFLLDRTDSENEKKEIEKLRDFVNKHFKEMEISHFERLFDKIDLSLKGTFNLQYRMHPDINEVIKQFYIKDGGLECGLITPIDLGVNDPDIKNNNASRYHGIEIKNFISNVQLTKDNHVIWIDTNSPEFLDGTSRVNYGEVEAIREVLLQLNISDSFQQYQAVWDNPEDKEIGIVSFYAKQLKLLKDLKKKKELADIPLRISTVDRFQGMERNIIIVSMVRSNCIATQSTQKPNFQLYPQLGYKKQESLGFAQSPNRLNVALSRAKRLLIIVGNSQLFRKKDIYKNVYKTIKSNPNGLIIKYGAK